MLIVVGANVLVFWSLAADVGSGRVSLGQVVAFAQAALGTSHDRVRRPQLGARRRGGARGRRAPTRSRPCSAAVHWPPGRARRTGLPAREIRFRDVTFAYPGGTPVLDGFDLTIPAGSSLAIVGQNGAGKTTLAKLLCRLYDPQAGAIEVDGVDLRDLDLDGWRSRVDRGLPGLHPLRAAAA